MTIKTVVVLDVIYRNSPSTVATDMNIQISLDDLKTLTVGAALLKGYLVAESTAMLTRQMKIVQSEDDEILLEEMKNGWFLFSMAKIWYDIGMTAPRQSKYLKELRGKGIIKTEIWDPPGYRHIRVRKENEIGQR